VSGNLRRAMLAKVHCAKRDLRLDDDAYRDMLESLTGKRSAGELDDEQLGDLLEKLRPLTGQPRKKSRGTPPANMQSDPDRAGLYSKIEAQLAEAKRPWAYAAGIAKRMYKRERLEFCGPNELRGIISALEQDAKRHGRQT
jgi:phage gp16-like protein